ncbi:MAG TPA: CPBP family intramembrane glutamic endopeptidase [Rhizomicrobium sp.]|nr:CPBP family intramembrane glutamic endopeptidase [Rhizomicrobium sp.]
MVRVLRSLPFALEFTIVVSLAFGQFVVTSLLVAFGLLVIPQTTASLVHLVIFEIGIMAVVFPFLRVRGWTFEKIGFRPALKDTGIGIVLFIAGYAAWAFVWYATVLVSPRVAAGMSGSRVFTESIHPAVSLAVGLVNPFFEEVFVCGYLMTALKRYPQLALNVSVALRVLYHLYQGPKGVLSITPIGLIFSSWYARTGRLWPLVVAHSIFDLIALLTAGYVH